MSISRVLAASVVALGLATGGATATTVTVDFEGFSGFFAPDFDFGGVSFQAADPGQGFQVGSFGALGPGQTGTVARASVPPFGAAPRDSITGNFLGDTVTFISVVAGDSGSDIDVFNLQGFDVNGSLVAETGLVSSAAATTLSISGTGISSFLLSISDNVPGNGGSSVIDNFTFTQELAPVPLPASLPLLGAGILAFGAIARRRRKSAVT